MKLTQKDITQFREWLNINWENITWQGQYEKDYSLFWDLFFQGSPTLETMAERFSLAQSAVSIGPLRSWFQWLEDKYYCYCFIYLDCSLGYLSDKTHKPLSYLAIVLRNYFLDRYPKGETYLNELFRIVDYDIAGRDLTYKKMEIDLQEEESFIGDEEIMSNLEVTLYEEWADFLKVLQSKEVKGPIIPSKLGKKGKQLFKEIIMLGLLGLGGMQGVKYFNKQYELYLADKIRLYRPDFLGSKKSLSFRGKRSLLGQDRKLFALGDIEFPKKEMYIEEESRFETESDVLVTSIDSLPQDFSSADLTPSQYEELRKGGYRDDRYGQRKVYRVMMKSVDSERTVNKVNSLVGEFEILQVDNVRPGTPVPGGTYYNLLVPSKNLKSFLSGVSKVGKNVMYVSRTRRAVEKGKTKVFIWIKQL